jgi:hypothetical protein
MVSSEKPQDGDLRVWWIPQVPGKPFTVPVATIAEGRKICDVLADYDLFQFRHRVKGDYANAGGLSRYEADGDGGFDWYDVDPDEED